MLLIAVVVLQVVVVLLLVALVLRKPAPVPATDERLLRLPDAVVELKARADATEQALRGGMDSLRRHAGEDAERSRAAADVASRGLRDEVATSIAALAKTLQDGLGGFRADNTLAADKLRAAVHAELQGIATGLETFFQRANRETLDSREALNTKLTEVSETLRGSLAEFRGDNTGSADKLRTAVQGDLQAIATNLNGFFQRVSQSTLESREALHGRLRDLNDTSAASHTTLRDDLQKRLTQLGEEQHGHQERMRLSMEDRLAKLNDTNAAKLEEMRHTVDEKLQATLHTRLTESFGQVTTHLGDVQKGLGEMKELATGVSDLKKVFSNVKARGIVGEFQLGMQLEQMFSPDQYVRNARIKPGSSESVEFALKIPDGDRDHVLLPIDAKFPREDWERLEHAYEHGTPEEQASAGRAFESAIRTEGKRICSKYIDPPTTLPFAVMFLPTEALYAEVMRRPALHTDLQSSCNVTIAGPSSFMAILTSFQMGFRTLAIQKKGSEVWKILGGVKTEFGKFETLMTKVENNVSTVQKTLGDIGVRTRAINRNLRGVSELPASEVTPLEAFEEIAHVAPLLAATADE